MESYDRFFPNQATVPVGGFGNLIALPLQGQARIKNNSLFIRDDGEPFSAQWDFLQGISRVTSQQLNKVVEDTANEWDALGLIEPSHLSVPNSHTVKLAPRNPRNAAFSPYVEGRKPPFDTH